MAMTSRRKPQGWQDPVKGHAAFRAIQSWLVAQGIGGALALVLFGLIWAVGYPAWARVSVAEGLVMGALFALSAVFLGVVNWVYMGREMARRLVAEGKGPAPVAAGSRRARGIVLAVLAALTVVSLSGEYLLSGGLDDWRASPPSMLPFFRMPSMAGLFATLSLIALVHLLRSPRGGPA